MNRINEYLNTYWPIMALSLGAIFSSGGAWTRLAAVETTLMEFKPKVNDISMMEVKISSMEVNISEIRKLMELYFIYREESE